MKEGIKVKMVNCAEAEKYSDRIWITRSESWFLSNGTEIILLDGKAGGFACDCLKEVR